MSDHDFAKRIAAYYYSFNALIRYHPEVLGRTFKDVYTENEWKVLLASPDEIKRKIAKAVLNECYGENKSEKHTTR